MNKSVKYTDMNSNICYSIPYQALVNSNPFGMVFTSIRKGIRKTARIYQSVQGKNMTGVLYTHSFNHLPYGRYNRSGKEK